MVAFCIATLNKQFEQMIGFFDILLYFSPFDSLPMACKEWKYFVREDHTYFWDIVERKLEHRFLDNHDYIKLDDFFEIIKFIKPEDIQLFLRTCKFSDKK